MADPSRRPSVPRIKNLEPLEESHLYDLAWFTLGLSRRTLVASGIRGFFRPNDEPAGHPCNRFEVRGGLLLIRGLHCVSERGEVHELATEQVPVAACERVVVSLHMPTGSADYGEGYGSRLSVIPRDGEVPDGAMLLGVVALSVAQCLVFLAVPPLQRLDATDATRREWLRVQAAARASAARPAAAGAEPASARLRDSLRRLADLGPAPTVEAYLAAAADLARAARLADPASDFEPFPEPPSTRYAEAQAVVRHLGDLAARLETSPKVADQPAPEPPVRARRRPTRRQLAGLAVGTLAVAGLLPLLAMGRGRPAPVAAINRPAPPPLAEIGLRSFDRPLLPPEIDRLTFEVRPIPGTDEGRLRGARVAWELSRPGAYGPLASGEVPLSGAAAAVAKAVDPALATATLPAELRLAVVLTPTAGGPRSVVSPWATTPIALPRGLTYPAPDPDGHGSPVPVRRDSAGRPVYTCRRDADGALVSLLFDESSRSYLLVDQGLVTVAQYLDRFVIPNQEKLVRAATELAARQPSYPVWIRSDSSLGTTNEVVQVWGPEELSRYLLWPFLHARNPLPGSEGYRVYPAEPFLQQRFNLVVKPEDLPDGKTTDNLPVVGVCGLDAKLYLDWVREATGEPGWGLCDASRQATLVRHVPSGGAGAGRLATRPSPASAGRDERGIAFAVGNLIELGEPAGGEVPTFGTDWRGQSLPERVPATMRLPNTGFRLSMRLPRLGDDGPSDAPARTTAQLERTARP